MPNEMQDLAFIQEAFKEAQKAADLGEVPVGAVVVCEGKIVGRGHNARESEKNVLRHAEISAIDEACRTLGGWRLHRCEIYVTMEPCLMCAGAILHARIKRVVFGARDEKFGAFGSVTDVNLLGFTHRCELKAGVCEIESKALLQSFFVQLRQKRNRKEGKA